MAIKDIIKVLSKPSIALKEVALPDDSKLNDGNSSFITGKSGKSTKDSAGGLKPLVFINSVQIDDIEYLCIDETQDIPKLKIIFNDPIGSLNGANYPKNDPIVSVYIKTQSEKFKPIRCDFLIKEIKALGSDNYSFSIYGELYIPKLYNNTSKSYRNMTSKEALLNLAKDIDLGYAQNEFSTSDSMTWINSNNNSLDFISHISKHAYKDDDAFFTSFIDKYYNINLIDVAEQLNINSDLNTTYQNTTDSMLRSQNLEMSERLTGSDFDDSTVPIYLGNHSADIGRPQYINEYKLSGDVGSILQNRGYRHQIYYYDHKLNDDKFTSFYVNPVNIKGYVNRDLSLIPDDEILRSNLIKKWQSIDYGNAHSEWHAANTINDHNNIELNKVKMSVETGGINFQVIRGTGVYVSIYKDSIESMLEKSSRKEADGLIDNSIINESTQILDDGLSGRYYVGGVKYTYDINYDNYPYKTEFHLRKMNWMAEKNVL